MFGSNTPTLVHKRISFRFGDGEMLVRIRVIFLGLVRGMVCDGCDGGWGWGYRERGMGGGCEDEVGRVARVDVDGLDCEGGGG